LCINTLEPRMIAMIMEPIIRCCCTKGKRNRTTDVIDADAAATIRINNGIENFNISYIIILYSALFSSYGQFVPILQFCI
jgi:hypothetical protein